MDGFAVDKVALEDGFQDVIGKAQRGWGVTDEELAAAAAISPADLERLKSGEFNGPVIRNVAQVLRLRPRALAALARNEWYPQDPRPVPGLACFTTPFRDGMTVNSYLVCDLKSRNAVAFDTGTDCSPMIRYAAERQIRIQMVLLTHTHEDHVADLERLKELLLIAAFVSKLEPFPGAEGFEPGRSFRAGNLVIGTRSTTGHSAGGTTYVVLGAPRRIAVVGDAIFAGSMGGGSVSYEQALQTNREQILTLPDDTVLCPGHGPLTTVGQEKSHNPFLEDLPDLPEAQHDLQRGVEEFVVGRA